MKVSPIITRHGYTIQQVADKLQVSRGAITATIGKSGNPTIGTLRKIAEAIGASLIEFFEDELEPGGEVCSQIQAETTTKLVCPHCGKTITIHAD